MLAMMPMMVVCRQILMRKMVVERLMAITFEDDLVVLTMTMTMMVA